MEVGYICAFPVRVLLKAQVVSARSALLSNYEVLTLLRELDSEHVARQKTAVRIKKEEEACPGLEGNEKREKRPDRERGGPKEQRNSPIPPSMPIPPGLMGLIMPPNMPMPIIALSASGVNGPGVYG